MKLKYIIWLCLMLLSSWWPLAGQEDCIMMPNGISTDPGNPINPQCTEPLFLNTFDWRAQTYPHGSDGQSTIPSPFFTESDLDYLWNEGAYPLSAKDFEVEDGWELIRFRPGNSTMAILYNKYTSILRLLFFIPNSQEDYDAITGRIHFNGEEGTLSALLHPSTGVNQALDQPSVGSINSTVRFTNNESGTQNFMHIDIPVEYDPCTCETDNSNIKIDFEKVNNMILELDGRWVELTQNLASIQGGYGTIDEDFLTQVHNDDSGVGSGAHVFSSYNSLVGHYEKLKDQQAELKKKYELYKLFGDLVKLVKTTTLLNGIKVLKNPFDTDEEIKGKEVLDVIAASSGLLGARTVKKELDGITGKVNRLGATTFSHGEMTVKGGITDTSPSGTFINFTTPGSGTTYSCNNTAPIIYPMYNEVLGRFAVLETPEVKIDWSWLISPGDDCQGYFHAIQFDPSSLKYVFNPAAQINEAETQILASLQFTTNLECESGSNGAFSRDENLLEIERRGGSTKYSTPLMPLSCLGEYSSVLNYDTYPEDLSVELTLVVEYVFEGTDNEGETPNAIQFYHYPVSVSDYEFHPYPEFMSEFYFTAPSYTYEDNIPTTNFTSNQTIFAWSSITIEGDLTTNPGVQVQIIAPSIDVLPDVFIGSNIDLIIDDTPFGECTPIEPTSPVDVIAFCRSDRYQANNAVAGTAPEPLVGDLPPPGGPVASNLDKEVFGAAKVVPNPTGDNAAYVLFELPERDQVSLSIVDLNGRLVSTVFEAHTLEGGQHRFELPTKRLREGAYILRLTTSTQSEAIRFVR